VPVIKSAAKKLRKDKKRNSLNEKVRKSLKSVFKKALKNPTISNISSATKIIDKAAKNKIIHKNKAARIKSKLSRLTPKSLPKPQAKKRKKTAKKS